MGDAAAVDRTIAQSVVFVSTGAPPKAEIANPFIRSVLA